MWCCIPVYYNYVPIYYFIVPHINLNVVYYFKQNFATLLFLVIMSPF